MEFFLAMRVKDHLFLHLEAVLLQYPGYHEGYRGRRCQPGRLDARHIYEPRRFIFMPDNKIVSGNGPQTGKLRDDVIPVYRGDKPFGPFENFFKACLGGR